MVVRVGEERTAALGFGVAALGTAGVALALSAVGGRRSAGLVVSSPVAGLGSGLAFAAVFALAGRDAPIDRRGAAAGVVVAAQYLASARGLAAFGVLTGPVGHRGVLVAGAASAVGAVAAVAGGRRGARDDQAPSRS